jgi:hypothetical protein
MVRSLGNGRLARYQAPWFAGAAWGTLLCVRNAGVGPERIHADHFGL